jgi:hypothetical protein
MQCQLLRVCIAKHKKATVLVLQTLASTRFLIRLLPFFASSLAQGQDPINSRTSTFSRQ